MKKLVVILIIILLLVFLFQVSFDKLWGNSSAWRVRRVETKTKNSVNINRLENKNGLYSNTDDMLWPSPYSHFPRVVILHGSGKY
jgi:uncharacterized membrane protein